MIGRNTEPGPPPAVSLTVAQVRQHVYYAALAPTAGSDGTGPAAGRLFHLCAAALLDPQSPAWWQRVLSDEPSPDGRLADTLYDAVLGPELARCRAALSGEQLLAVWNAVRRFSSWFATLVDEARRAGAIRFDARRERWEGAGNLFTAEVDVEREFYQPEWRAPVRLTGRADHVLRLSPSRWCVLEFKLGPGHPEADALQACLYHELLAPAGPDTAAALVRFGPHAIEETLLHESHIAAARPALLRLLASIAGVLPESSSPPQAAAPASAAEPELQLARRIAKTLEEFKSPVTLLGDPVVGPAFVRFFVQPQRGVSTNSVLKQGPNLHARLEARTEPVIHIVDGRVAIDVARPSRDTVLFSSLEGQIPRPEGGSSRALVGVDLSNKVEFLDFAAPEHAHVLVAGVAGSGKSEWLRTALASLALANTPDTLRFVLIDPKRNAFLDLAASPFLLTPQSLLHPPQDDVIPVLEELVEEMERRSRLFESARADHLAAYRRQTGEPLPRIIVACDEFADLVLASRSNRAQIELILNRLGQKARAAGIHLVIATQTPRKDVVSGILRANTPARIALRVTSMVESRLILDRNGAEKLLGRGDLLFASNHEPIRLQAPWLPDDARRALFARPRTFSGAV